MPEPSSLLMLDQYEDNKKQKQQRLDIREYQPGLRVEGMAPRAHKEMKTKSPRTLASLSINFRKVFEKKEAGA